MDESLQTYLEQPAVKTLKLSEAIRIGAKIRPQCFGFSEADGKSCVVMAACEAVTGTLAWPVASDGRRIDLYVFVADYFDVPLHLVESVIPRRNDAGESRESIADWLEQQGY